MKIKNLLLLGLMTLMSASVWAADPVKFVKDGIQYKPITGKVDASKFTAEVTVEGIAENTKGKAIKTAKSVEIPASVTVNVDEDVWTITVKGLENAWMKAGTGFTDISDATSVTINIDNFTALPTATQLPDAAAVTTFTLKGTSTIDANLTIPDYTGALAALKTLDLSALAPKSGKKITLGTLTVSTKLETVKLPGIDVAASAFSGFTGLKTVTGTKNIGNSAFNGLSNLTSIDLSKAETIGSNAFKGTKITAANLSKATTVGASAFEGVVTITSLEIPATLATIGDDAFKDMTGLTELTINRNSTNSHVKAVFAGCNKVTTLNLVGAYSVANNAFADMPLTKIDLSKCPNLNVPSNAFKAGQALTKVKLAGSSTPLSKIDLSNSQNSLKSITLMAMESSIPVNKFKGFVKLASINLPATITSIGANAFDGTALEAITIPEGCTVGVSAFANCSALATVTFANETGAPTTIRNNAFEATALTEVVLPENVDFVGGTDAFKDCAVLKTFVAEGITTVPAAFAGCDKLKAVVLPGTVTTIAPNAFKDLAKLGSVKFNYDPEDAGQTLTSIGFSAFENCVALTAIDLSATKLTSLGNNNVFKGCVALATITLPEEMNNLGYGIFAGTAIETLDASMVDGNVNNIFGTDLSANNSLKVLKLGNATISGFAFADCTKLKTLVTGAATILGYAFESCEKLATVTVDPRDEVTGTKASISSNAFDHCTALTTFNYSTDEIDLSKWGNLNPRAFSYCTPYVTINTTKEFAAKYGNAPVNATWTADAITTIVKTVQDKANPNQFVAKFWAPAYDVAFNADDVKLYSVYVDGENAYFSACRAISGKYYVNAGEHVILKTTEEKEVPYSVVTSVPTNSVAFDDMVSLAVDGELGDIQFMLGVGTSDYIYRLTNTAEQGFGFTAYSSTTVKANQFFIKTTKKPASGRLNNVWLDEDGNVEGETTAIKNIESVNANDGAIYNMQGVRVEKAQKGIYIQNGKKFVVK